jgi:hypothetical protein
MCYASALVNFCCYCISALVVASAVIASVLLGVLNTICFVVLAKVSAVIASVLLEIAVF